MTAPEWRSLFELALPSRTEEGDLVEANEEGYLDVAVDPAHSSVVRLLVHDGTELAEVYLTTLEASLVAEALRLAHGRLDA